MKRKVRRKKATRLIARTHREGESLIRKKSLSVGLLNVNGYSQTSAKDVEDAMSKLDVDVMCIVETKMRTEDREKIKMKGFDVYETRRADADGDKQGGGLAIFARRKDGIIFKRYDPEIKEEDLAFVNKERLWVTYDSKVGKTAVCCIYLGCQNSSDSHGQWNDDILSVLASEVFELRSLGYRINLQGDFNCWVGSDILHGGIQGNDERVNKNGQRFISFCNDNNLVHLNGAVRVPGDWSTRVSAGLWTRHSPSYGSSTVLDYSVISREHLDSVRGLTIDNDGAMGGGSDHNMLLTRLEDRFVRVEREVRRQKRPGWDIEEEQDWTGYRQQVNKELAEAGGSDDGTAEFLAGKLGRVMMNSMEKAIGYKKPSLPTDHGKLPRAVVRLLLERKKLEAAWKKKKSKFASANYASQEDSILVAAQALEEKELEVNLALKRFNSQGRRRLLHLCRGKTKKARALFWKHVSFKVKAPTDISALQSKRTGVLLCSPEQIADESYQYMMRIFSGVETHQDHNDHEETRGRAAAEDPEHSYAQQLPRGATVGDHEYAVDENPVLQSKDDSRTCSTDPSGFLDKDFSDKEVQQVVSSLGNCKAAGWDRIPNEALKEAPLPLLKQLTVLFNRVKNRGKVPTGWKRGRVVLVHKKGPTVDVNNYRPLTVLVSVSGIYTKLLNQRLTQVVEEHKLLGEVQHGFRKGRSGADCAFVLNSVLWKSAAKKKKAHLAFIDLTKAYDSVDRAVLWRKLEAMGIKGKFLASIKALYDGDFVTAEVNGVTTSPVYLRRGVRQGCSLSPMLFALYIAEMGQDLTGSGVGITLHRICVSAIFFADGECVCNGTCTSGDSRKVLC